jgi:hypothetical protein
MIRVVEVGVVQGLALTLIDRPRIAVLETRRSARERAPRNLFGNWSRPTWSLSGVLLQITVPPYRTAAMRGLKAGRIRSIPDSWFSAGADLQ